MTRMLAAGAMTLTLLVAMPGLAGEPVRLSEHDLDQVTAGLSFDALFRIRLPGVPAGDVPDDDIWDLLGSGVVGQGAVLERFRGLLRHVPFRQR